MVESLKHKTSRGLLWSSVERFSNQGVQFLFSIILARILTPSDYGIVAMIAIFFAVAQSFVDSGFSNALVRKTDRKEEDLSTCFYFNIVVGIISYILLFLIAPLVAGFYNLPILSSIIRVTGLGIILNSLCVVQQALYTINIDFKSQAKVTLTATILSGIVGIVLAYRGLGVWSLVWQGIAGSLARMVLLWLMSKWRPRTGFSRESFNYLFGYGSKLLVSGLFDTVYRNIYPIIIGKFYTSAQLGNFSRALGWAQLPSSNITGVLQRVTFPVLSTIQDDLPRLQSDYRRLLRASAFVVFPLMVGLAAIASPLIRVVLTSKWDGCVMYLQIVCFALMWYPIHAINLNLLQVKGRSDLFLNLEVIKKIIGVCIMCVTIPLGVVAMCVGMIFSSMFSLIINTYYTGKLIDVGYLKQLKDLLPIFLNSVLMGVVVYFCTLTIDGEIFKLITGMFLGFICYLGGSFLFSREELRECKGMFKK
ncbi:lipopolysaccharide biosynthesis protein [Prevotella sp. kh1p2]|uniref:lipopolysaccharide biosynthesis protein n=1 Tax=Prevotella sp. kh1p2 TaxID=1761883 RepID=UPI0008ABD5DC|nr:lipopolysaccharide biosynthesis protein [Prevotella sp. kh1p2]SET11410.1 Membrane protein involved in the export of O-antigen and teichoic acid [Prevotella sp. kh1p2]SNU11809.1 Membrane protein involved in the export of O-antigen and teichoic acid [Prevotellaceae bacterium KH2P17]